MPYALVHQEVDVHLTAETLEVLHRGVRVASHVRSYVLGKATTLTEHMPKAHQKYVGRTPSRLIEDAQQIGPNTGQLVEAILACRHHRRNSHSPHRAPLPGAMRNEEITDGTEPVAVERGQRSRT